MNITQTFYDQLAEHYDELFADWQAATRERAALSERVFGARGVYQPIIAEKAGVPACC